MNSSDISFTDRVPHHFLDLSVDHVFLALRLLFLCPFLELRFLGLLVCANALVVPDNWSYSVSTEGKENRRSNALDADFLSTEIEKVVADLGTDVLSLVVEDALDEPVGLLDVEFEVVKAQESGQTTFSFALQSHPTESTSD